MTCKAFAYLLMLATVATTALAGDDGFKPDELEPSRGWVKWVFVMLFIGLIAIAAFKNAKRTHLD